MKKFTLLFFSLVCLSTYAQQWNWAKDIQCQANQYISEMSSDAVGNIYMRFRTNSTGLFEGFPVDSGCYIAKFNPSGSILWVKNYPSISKMTFDHNGILNVTGQFNGNLVIDSYNVVSNGGDDFYFMKLNAGGVVIALKTFGGTGNDFSSGLGIDLDNEIYITGKFSNAISFDGITVTDTMGHGSFYVVSLDSSLDTKWAKQGNWDHYAGYDIAIDDKKNSYVWGPYIDTCYMCGGGYFTAKYDLNGNRTQLSSYPYPSGYGCSYDIETNGHENLYKLGYCNTTHSSTPALFKYDSLLNLIYVKQIAKDYYFNLGQGMSFDEEDNIYLCGGIGSWAMHDSVMIDSIWVSILGKEADGLVAKMDSDGNILWFLSAYGAQNEYFRAITTDAYKNIYVFGSYDNYLGPDTVAFGSQTLIGSNTSKQWFLAKISQSSLTSTKDLSLSDNYVKVYPNPSSGVVTIQIQNCRTSAKVIVRDVFGKCLIEKSFRCQRDEDINLSSHPKGIYFMEIAVDGKRSVRKIVMQ